MSDWNVCLFIKTVSLELMSLYTTLKNMGSIEMGL